MLPPHCDIIDHPGGVVYFEERSKGSGVFRQQSSHFQGAGRVFQRWGDRS